jgi:hypothetical protein
MNDTTRKPLEPFDKEGIRKVIIGQYLLHEVKHHPARTGREPGARPVSPRAHAMADIYKILHQGTFGYGPGAGSAPGQPHIPNKDFFIGHLTNEYFKALSNPEEAVLEFVAPDDSIFRVNIRPYKTLFKGQERKGFDMLADLVLDSSEVEKGSLRQFFASLKSFVELNSSEELKIEGISYMIPPIEVNSFLNDVDRFVRSRGWIPLMGQSENYHRLVKPAYVVADLSVLKESPLAFLLKDTKE